MCSVVVNFSVKLNDGGNGHAEDFTLEALGIDPAGMSEEQIDVAVQEAYEAWVWNFNMGGWGYA